MPPTAADMLAAIQALTAKVDSVKTELDTLAELTVVLARKLDALELGLYGRFDQLKARE